MDGKPKGCKLAERIVTKFHVNQKMRSTFKTLNLFEA